MTDATSYDNTPLQLLIQVSSHLHNEESHDSCQRSINFMTYELATLCDGKNKDEVLQTLNLFFFTTKKFKICAKPVLLKYILTDRTGCGIALSFIYMHLAKGLGLNLELIHWPLHAILKWQTESKAHFIDLEQNGQLLTEEELLLIVNKHKDQVRTLSFNEAQVQYLAYISTHFRQNHENELLHKTLGMILKIEPENSRYLAERALLRREMGLSKEALCDFKRYFSFTDRASAPAHLTEAYDGLTDTRI